jgi:hypothetical protein
MCLRFQFCTHQRVCTCILYFLKKVKFVVPYSASFLHLAFHHKSLEIWFKRVPVQLKSW